MQFLWVGLGGFLGANARYLVALWAAGRYGVNFPYGTLIANVVGCFCIGFFLTLTTEWLTVPTEIRLFVAVGFLGGFTTFSSFSFETFALVEQNRWGTAILNLFADIILGFIGVILGIYLARWLQSIDSSL